MPYFFDTSDKIRILPLSLSDYFLNTVEFFNSNAQSEHITVLHFDDPHRSMPTTPPSQTDKTLALVAQSGSKK